MEPVFDPTTVPADPVIALYVTATAAFCNNNPVAVPFDIDPRIAATAAGLSIARKLGRPVRATLYGLNRAAEDLVLTPDGQVHLAHPPGPQQIAEQHQDDNAHTDGEPRGHDEEFDFDFDFADPAPEPEEALEPAAEVPTFADEHDPWDDGFDEDAGDTDSQVPAAAPAARAKLRLVQPQESEKDFDPDKVQLWPRLAIVLDAQGRAFVEGQPVEVLPGEDVRTAAIHAAAARAIELGLSRPVRAVATDPDGTEWPLIVHPDGTATPAGEPRRIDPGRRRFRRAE